MHPFDERSERAEDGAGSKRQSCLTIIVILGIVALVVIAVVLHLAGGVPTHGR
jgi:predicted nucleic acid-binding Zn ribbon protein